MKIKHGATDQSVYFVLVDSDGAEATGLTITDLDIVYVRDKAAAVKADATALAAATSAHGDNQAIEVDATNAPGLHRVDFPDAAFVTGVNRVQLIVNGAAIKPAIIEVELVSKLVSELNDVSAADVNAQCDTALADYDAATGAEAAAIKAETALIVADTNELQTNQGNWLTATGFSTHSAADVKTAIEAGGSSIAGIKAKTDNLPESPAAQAKLDDVESRLTAVRAGYLDKLNVSGTLANSDAADTYKANVSGLSTLTAQQVWEYVTRELTSAGSGGATAQEVWEYATRALTDKSGFTISGTKQTLDALHDFDPANDTVANVTAVASVTGGVTVAANEDKSGYSLTTAPPTAAEIKTALEASGSTLDIISKHLDPDIKVNMTTTPWQEEYYESGTETLLYAKKLYDSSGDAVASIETYAAYKQENALA